MDFGPIQGCIDELEPNYPRNPQPQKGELVAGEGFEPSKAEPGDLQIIGMTAISFQRLVNELRK